MFGAKIQVSLSIVGLSARFPFGLVGFDKTNKMTSKKRKQVITTDPVEASSQIDSLAPSKAAGSWGREGSVSWATTIQSFGILTVCPLMTLWFLSSCSQYQCNLASMPMALLSASSWDEAKGLMLSWVPAPTWKATGMWIGWVITQALMYVYVPGKIGYGQRTPAGHLLPYNVFLFTTKYGD